MGMTYTVKKDYHFNDEKAIEEGNFGWSLYDLIQKYKVAE